MSAGPPSSSPGEGTVHRNQMVEAEQSPRRGPSSTWSMLNKDTVPLLGDIERVEVEEGEARRQMIAGRRRTRWR